MLQINEGLVLNTNPSRAGLFCPYQDDEQVGKMLFDPSRVGLFCSYQDDEQVEKLLSHTGYRLYISKQHFHSLWCVGVDTLSRGKWPALFTLGRQSRPRLLLRRRPVTWGDGCQSLAKRKG